MSQTLLHKRTSNNNKNKTKAAAAGRSALKTAKTLIRQHKKLQGQNNNTAAQADAAHQVVAKVAGILGLYVAFDLEWDSETHVLLAASFVDNTGKRQVFLNTGSELELIKKIIGVLLHYKISMGWNNSTSIESNNNYTFIAPITTDYQNNIIEEAAETNGYSINLDTKCDIGILDERMKIHGLQNLNFIRRYIFGSKIYYSFNGFTHIDMYQVYGKTLVQSVIYANKYRTLKLKDVAIALLQIGKYKDISGKDFTKLSVKDKKAYVLRDPELVMELSKYNNYQILDVMNEIANTTNLPFEKVCRTNLTTWWGDIFDKMIADGKAPRAIRPVDVKLGRYKGALVLEPVQGYYQGGAILVDAASLYPTMAIVYNLSYETVNCHCCKYDKKAKVKILDDKFYEGYMYLTKDNFWICRKVKQQKGVFAQKLKDFRTEKARYTKLVEDAKRRKDEAAKVEYKAKLLATKILLNGGYGCFGSQQFLHRELPHTRTY